MKQLLSFLLLAVGLQTVVQAQSGEDLQKKTISDTILQHRTLTVPSPFNAQKALQKLFPGKYYNLSKDNYKNELINWDCKTCAVKKYPDVNEDAAGDFPFSEGVATRLINEISYQDSSGRQFKVICFNHSEYDPEGLQVSRFTGGLLGLAKFEQHESSWELVAFQPAVAAYGAFSQCPAPKLLQIGKDQFAFILKHLNGPGGGPFDGTWYLIAGLNGSYQQIMAAYGIERTETSAEEGLCYWSSEYKAPPSDKKYFRDIIITTKGTYRSTDPDAERLPEELRKLVKGKKTARFTLEQRYTYKGSKGYVLQEPITASLTQ